MILPFLLFLLIFGIVLVVVIVKGILGLSRRSWRNPGYRRSYFGNSPPFISYDSSGYGPGIPPVHVVHHMMDAAGQPISVDSGGHAVPDKSNAASMSSVSSESGSSFDSGSSGFDSGSSSGSSDCGGGGGSSCDCGGSSGGDSSSSG